MMGNATRSLSVTDHLREEILSGGLPAGTKLQEVRLSEELGVSRTPIRAALQSLAAAGLLDYAPNRGYVVRDFPISELVDAYEIRGALEGLAARFTAERGLDEAQRLVMEQSLTQGQAILNSTNQMDDHVLAVAGVTNAAFHDTIMDASLNRLLSQMAQMSFQIPRVSNRNIIAFSMDELRQRHDEHYLIYEALLARAASRAETLMRNHVASVKFAAVRALRERR
jgi:GntR family transcriptional regulator of vanillate catabolism